MGHTRIALPVAVIFDCDGLLLETESRWAMAEDALLQAHGSGLTPELQQSILGHALPDAAAILAKHLALSGSSVVSLGEELRANFLRVLKEKGVELLPGAKELLTEVKQSGRPVAVASNTYKPHVELALDIAGVRDEFDAVVCSGAEIAPKPAPDVYIAACAKLSAAPNESIALEDSQTGVSAAINAGLKTIAVPSLPNQKPPKATAVYTSLNDVSLDTLCQLFT